MSPKRFAVLLAISILCLTSGFAPAATTFTNPVKSAALDSLSGEPGCSE
jgi:hypothetical protein